MFDTGELVGVGSEVLHHSDVLPNLGFRDVDAYISFRMD